MSEQPASGPASRSDRSASQLNNAFEVLSHQHRRYVLYYLLDSDNGVASLDEVVEYVTETDEHFAPDAPTEAYERVRTELDVIHLPKLGDVGTVDYDRRTEMVRYVRVPSLEEWVEHAKYREGCSPE